jgi:putative radical SAM enzyme (TIGR03279 family)
MAVLIKRVIPNSPADKAGIKAGTRLISVNGAQINDVLDFMFHADEGMGLEFDTYLMDEKRHCGNKCVFCFIDQLPRGLRAPLYFKDDDSRLSFLQGNYITLTNLTERDTARIIAMRTPVNVSVHSTNPELRSRLTGTPKGGESLEILRRFAEAGIVMNCQLVLCPELNDGDELIRSLRDLSAMKSVESIACVPVGLTKHREGLPPLRAFTPDEAAKVIGTVGEFANTFAADEFYLLAGLPIPEYEHYGVMPQYENGVGMWAYLKHTFAEADAAHIRCGAPPDGASPAPVRRTIVTGTAAFPLISELAAPFGNVNVAAIRNDFFGESVTVSGLLTGRDIIAQLADFEGLGAEIIIGGNTLNADGVFLDDVTPADVEAALGVKVKISEADGYGLFSSITAITAIAGES